MALNEWIELILPYVAVCAPALFLYLTLLASEHMRQHAVQQAIRKYKQQQQLLQQAPPPSPPAAPPAKNA